MEKLQTQLTFFLMNRTVLGIIWVVKRMMFALTLGQLLEGSSTGAAVLLTVREGLSAITDYAQPRNPATTTSQSTPTNTEPIIPTDHVESGS